MGKTVVECHECFYFIITLFLSVSWAGMPVEFHAFWKSPCWYQGQIARVGTGAFRCRLVFERSTLKAFRSVQYPTWFFMIFLVQPFWSFLDKGSSIKWTKGVNQCKQPFETSTRIRSTARDSNKLSTFCQHPEKKKSSLNTYGPALCCLVHVLGCLTLGMLFDQNPQIGT